MVEKTETSHERIPRADSNRVRPPWPRCSNRARCPSGSASWSICATRNSTDLWALFAERLKAVNGKPLTTVAELVALLRIQRLAHRLLRSRPLAEAARGVFHGLHGETTSNRRRIDDYQFGITAATGAIAETRHRDPVGSRHVPAPRRARAVGAHRHRASHPDVFAD